MLVALAGSFVAARAKAPELALDEEEQEKVAKAVVNVGKHYDVPVSPLTQAWMGLASTIGMIYFSKIMLLKMTRAQARAEAANRNAPEVPVYQ